MEIQKLFAIILVVLIVIVTIIIIIMSSKNEKFSPLDGEIDHAMIMAIDFKTDNDKLKNLTEQLNHANVNYRVYKAIDGEVIDIKKLVFEGTYEGALKIRDKVVSPDQYACFISHLNIWEIFLKSDRNYCVVLGNNVMLGNNFKNRLAKTLEDLNDTNLDGVLLTDSKICKQQFNAQCTMNFPNDTKFNSNINHPIYLGNSCPAYIITREGARKLINNTIPISMPIESFFNQLNFNKRISIGRVKIPLVTIIE